MLRLASARKGSLGSRPLLIGLGLFVGLALAAGGALLLRPGRPADGPGPAPAVPAADDPLARAESLYANHCLACHGEKGDGEGPAARFLYPKPRNFGELRFRLASTANRIPSDDDLFRVISRGMPGSAMVPFGHLPEADRRGLVAYVRHLAVTAAEAQLKRQAAEAGEEPSADELAETLARITTPGEPVHPPDDWPAPDAASLARGRATYLTLCAPCHGATGKGDGVQDQRDDSGVPTRPRDFTLGIFKGERSREQLYARVLLGMSGTPMPGSPQLQPAEIGDLVNFVLSLSDEKAQAKVEHRRQRLAAARAAAPLPEVVPDEAWAAAAPAAVVVSPLWWRDYVPPELEVRALHDGQVLAVRLSWRDASRDDRISRPEDFEDMAAVQLFKGDVEPFLGMGTQAAAIDLWHWRATRTRPADESDSLLDTYPFDEPLYGRLARGPGRPPDFRTARAAGNLHAPSAEAPSAGSLEARGFGSTTFRPKASQLVTARAAWADGRWTVVLRRPLAVPSDAGLSLAPGDRCSVAFAIWDGAARDRNGQKLVSIWHDLTLE